MNKQMNSNGSREAKSKGQDQIQPVFVNEKLFAYDIWLFSITKNGDCKFNGIFRDGVLKTLQKMGYSKRYQDNKHYVFINEENNIIETCEIVNMKDSLYNRIKSLDSNMVFSYQGLSVKVSSNQLRELYNRQSHLVENKPFLEHLPTHNKTILRDEKGKSYYFFRNKYIEVTGRKITEYNYSELPDVCIWKDHIVKHNIEFPKDDVPSKFSDFINNVASHKKDRIKAFRSAIGYLLYNYSDRSDSQAVLLYDEEITDSNTPQGGTGKGIFASALGELREMVTVDGKKIDTNDRFRYQNVNESTQIFRVDDLKANVNFENFNSLLTEGWTVEKKNQLQFFIEHERSPKLVLSSNSILNNSGKTLIRRQFPLEFSSHYSSKLKNGSEKPVECEHGGMFFSSDWNQEEWNRFFAYMMECVQFYLRNGLVSYTHKNIAKNVLIQSTSKEFFNWSQRQNFNCKEEYPTKQYYEDFITNYWGEGGSFSQRAFSNCLTKYADSMIWRKETKQSNGLSVFWFQYISV
jgi:hypothetical protein